MNKKEINATKTEIHNTLTGLVETIESFDIETGVVESQIQLVNDKLNTVRSLITKISPYLLQRETRYFQDLEDFCETHIDMYTLSLKSRKLLTQKQ